MLGSSLPPVVCRRAYVLFTLFLYCGIHYIMCCVFVMFFFVLLPVSLDSPLLIAPSVFSNVYLYTTTKERNGTAKLPMHTTQHLIGYMVYQPHNRTNCILQHQIKKWQINRTNNMPWREMKWVVVQRNRSI
jgi:hypothetical protein